MKAGFDERIVSYEYIHNISPEDEKALLDAINPQPGEKILDTFCGYGAVSKNCLKREKTIDLWLNDVSEVQLKRARKNLPELLEERFILGYFPEIKLTDGSFDKVFIKMGLHEVPKEEQARVAKKIFGLLKPGGKFIVWDIMLNDENQELFQDVIRKKDELAGFDRLAKERYFFREDEFLETMSEAGFEKIKEFHSINYRFSSRKRLEQELHNDKSLLEQLNKFIRERFPERLKEILKYEDLGDDIQFTITKKIYAMEK